jgi:Family of unknown function (DUF6496)
MELDAPWILSSLPFSLLGSRCEFFTRNYVLPEADRSNKDLRALYGDFMPEQETLNRARKDAAEGKSASTQAGEFVREEIHHVREGKHGVSSAKQAIAIGLSKARRAGVKLPSPKGSSDVKHKAAQDTKAGKTPHRKVSRSRQRATSKALRRKPRQGASKKALSRQAKSVARKRGGASRRASARKAARTRAR